MLLEAVAFTGEGGGQGFLCMGGVCAESPVLVFPFPLLRYEGEILVGTLLLLQNVVLLPQECSHLHNGFMKLRALLASCGNSGIPSFPNLPPNLCELVIDFLQTF